MIAPLYSKTCSNFPHHSAFSQQLQTGTNGRPGYIQWGDFEHTKKGAILNTAQMNNQFNSNFKQFQVNLIFNFPQNQFDDDSIKLYTLQKKPI